MKNYVQPGATLSFTAGATYSSGAGVVIGGLFGVVAADVASGDSGEAEIVGVFDLTKVGSQAWAEGARVYWDAGNSRCTTTAASGLLLIGTATAAVGSGAGETTGRVRLNGACYPVAANVADASAGSAAEINALRDALIAAGIMAPAA